jgi:hypothetical protein
MSPEQLAEARRLASSSRFGADAEYLRALLGVGLAILDRLEAPAPPVEVAPPATVAPAAPPKPSRKG